MNYSKPFTVYENNPIDTKNILKKTQKKIDLKNENLAVLDSIGVQNLPNSSRTIHTLYIKNKIARKPP